MYSAEVLDHLEHPRNAGELPGADVCVARENPACGDILQLALNCRSGRIAEVRFRAKGCVAAIACASKLTELILHKTPAEAQTLGRKQLIAALGGLPEASGHAAQLAIDTLAAALQELVARL